MKSSIEKRLSILGENDCFICKKLVKDKDAEFAPYTTENEEYMLLVHKQHKGIVTEEDKS